MLYDNNIDFTSSFIRTHCSQHGRKYSSTISTVPMYINLILSEVQYQYVYMHTVFEYIKYIHTYIHTYYIVHTVHHMNTVTLTLTIYIYEYSKPKSNPKPKPVN